MSGVAPPELARGAEAVTAVIVPGAVPLEAEVPEEPPVPEVPDEPFVPEVPSPPAAPAKFTVHVE
jgi:hypothetical protein